MQIVCESTPQGKANAIANARLREIVAENGLFISEVDLRELMSQIRHSIPKQVLGGSDKGYYWCETLEEAMNYTQSRQNIVNEMQAAIKSCFTTIAIYYNKESITPEYLIECGFEFVEKRGFDIYRHVERNLIFKQSKNTLGVWGVMETINDSEPKKLFNRKSLLTEYLKDRGVICD